MSADWLEHFSAFSSLHAATVVFFAAFWAVLITVGIRLRGGAMEMPWRRGLSIAILVAWVWANGVQLLPGRYVAADNLPLQICDIAGMVLPFALWTRARLLFSVLYFCGLGFSVVAMIAPDLRGGIASVDFWTFWIPHANLTGAAAYLFAVERFRPRWRDCANAYALTVVYLLVMLPFDLLSGFNYGYVGPDRPLQPAAIAHFGPWPWRVLVFVVLTAVVFALLQLPWLRRRGVVVADQNPRSVA